MELTDSQPPTTSLHIELFGAFNVRVEGRPLPRLRSRKGQWLLALLVLRSGRDVDRNWLAATLWPESSEQQAFANLRLSLTDLRHALGPEAVRLSSLTPRTLCLDLNGAAVDVLSFDAALKRGDVASLEYALGLYRGPLLEGCLEEWVLQEREMRAQSYLQALESLASNAAEREDNESAAQYLRALVAADPLREKAQRALMQALAKGGNYAAAVLTYRQFRNFLRRTMSAEPDPDTRALFQQIRSDARRRAQVETPLIPLKKPDEQHLPMGDESPNPASHRDGNLPYQRTSFIGRRREIDALQKLLVMPQPRLVTLTGAGGYGKTRLALRVAEGLRDHYQDGVWMVELAPVSDPLLVPQEAASALAVQEQPERSLTETLEDYLKPLSLLLLLDNCEHLLDGCAALVDRLLQSCPNLHILATSRERLRVPGELAYRVPSMKMPGPTEAPLAEQALEYEAVRLFVERTLFFREDFVLTDENLPDVIHICQRLDGSPLAIELAAARTRILTVEQIAQRLDDRFRLLTDGNRAALPRHQTLRATIDWSYDLLDEAERALVRRLSVFAGGWSLEAAEAIGAELATKERDVLHLLASLVDKSLVIAEKNQETGDMRYSFLETVRQYGQEHLGESGEAGGARRRHLEWYLSFAAQADTNLWSEDGPVWIKRLEIELDNLRSALEYSRELEDECEAGMFMAGSLAQFWYMRGYWSEGRDWLEEMRRRGHSRATAGRAKMLLGIGILAWDQDDYRAARPCLEQSRDIYHQLDDSEGYAVSSLVLGSVLGTMGEYTTAEELLKDAQEYHMRAGVPRDTVFCLVYRARIAFEQEDYATARSLSEECLAISRPLEHRWGSAFALMLLGSIAGKEGQFDRAIALCQESTALSEILGNKRGAARSRLVIGLIACRQELFAEANTHFQSCLRIFRELGDKEGLCYTFEGMALLAALSDRFEYAVRLLSTAQTLRDSLGIPLPPSSRTMKEKWLTRARAQLDAELFARAWAEGAAVEYGVTLPARLPEASKG